MKVIAVIPAFNEARTIAKVVQEVAAHVRHVVVVDDGSCDDTAVLAAQAGASVVPHPLNRGKAQAMRTGFEQAAALGAEWILTLDGDGQHPAQRITPMLEIGRRHPTAVVIGARLLDRAHAPPLRRFANRFADFWIGWAAGQPLRDTQSGFRLYPQAIARALPPPERPDHGFTYESEILIAIGRLGGEIIHHPIETLYPAGNRASHYQGWRDTSRIVRMVAARLLPRRLSARDLLRSLDHRHCRILARGSHPSPATTQPIPPGVEHSHDRNPACRPTGGAILSIAKDDS